MEEILQKSRANEFRAFLRKVVEANPTGPGAGQALFHLARGLYERKAYAEAIPELERFSTEFAADPALPKAELYLAQSYFYLKDFQRAAPVFERYAQSYPGTPDAPMALFQLGNAYYGLNQYKDVEAPFQKLLHDYPESEYAALARFNLALAYQDAGEFEQANVAYETYIKAGAKPEAVISALWSIFENQQKMGAWPAAISTLNRVLGAVKKGSDVALEATYKIGELHLTVGDETQARRVWEGLMRQHPPSSDYRMQAGLQLAKLYEKQHQYAQAIATYKDVAANVRKKSVARAARERIQELTALQHSGKEK